MTRTKNTFFVSMMVLMAVGTEMLEAANISFTIDPVQIDSFTQLAKQADVVKQAEMKPKVGGKYLPDAVVIEEKLHHTANLSYQVAGKRYYPTKKVADDFSQTGLASWYGPGFHGRKTSNGERFDMNMMTAAHPTLPIPSYARVTNLSNGKTIVVRINDRGPFHGNRVMDLSKAAANKLGFLPDGVAQIRIEPLKAGQRLKEPMVKVAKNQVQPKPTNHAQNPNIYVNLKQFDNKRAAQDFLKVASQHLEKNKGTHRAILVQQGQAYMVRVGPFIEQKHADEVRKSLKQKVI